MSTLERVNFDIMGQQLLRGEKEHVVIGDALFCAEGSTLTDKAKFVLTLRRPAINYYKTFLVPRDVVLKDEFASIFRVCNSSESADGQCTTYGIGALVPTQGALCEKSFYYELVPDFGHIIWQRGRFVAHLDPHGLPDFFTISDAAA